MEKKLIAGEWVQVSDGTKTETVQVKDGLVTFTISATAPVGRFRDFDMDKSKNGGFLSVTPPDVMWATATVGEAIVAVTYG
ncbi:hypothetical protein M6B24_06210 [Enterobacter bugandensis]|nr:hypothetical protein [Enterobacter bugandensis]